MKIPHPAKFSMDDRYQHYRMKMRRLAEYEAGPGKAGEEDKKSLNDGSDGASMNSTKSFIS